MRKFILCIFITLILLLVSIIFSCRVLNNPVDPEAESYQGYPTVSSADDVKQVEPEDGSYIFGVNISLTFLFTPFPGADLYHIQISSSQSDFVVNIVYENTGLTENRMNFANGLSHGTYYWRIRARDVSTSRWGDWSGIWSFVFSTINTGLAYQGLSMQVVTIIPEGSTDTYRDMTLTSYALSETEVTQGDYKAVMGSNPAHEYGVGSNYPVYYVSWYDAVRFCNALSTLLGLEEVYNEATWKADFIKNGFYLPIEAQWEYAAGGPNHYTWPLEDTFNASDYVYDDTQTRPVKSKPANGFVLYDTGGNVWEWCHDWYGGSYPHTGETDPTGPLSGSYRIFRGGCWYSTSSGLRCEGGGIVGPSYSPYYLGFRVAVGGFGS